MEKKKPNEDMKIIMLRRERRKLNRVRDIRCKDNWCNKNRWEKETVASKNWSHIDHKVARYLKIGLGSICSWANYVPEECCVFRRLIGSVWFFVSVENGSHTWQHGIQIEVSHRSEMWLYWLQLCATDNINIRAVSGRHRRSLGWFYGNHQILKWPPQLAVVWKI